MPRQASNLSSSHFPYVSQRLTNRFVMANCQLLFAGDLIKDEYNLTVEIMMNVRAFGFYSKKPNEEII